MKKRMQTIAIFLTLLFLGTGCKADERSSDEVTEQYIEMEQTAPQTDRDYASAYIDMLNSDDFEFYQFALAYIDEDDIPELVGNTPGYIYQICTCQADGEIICYEKMGYGLHSRDYYYLPGQNSIISTVAAQVGREVYEEHYILEEDKLELYMVTGKIYDEGFTLDDEGNLTISSYVKDDEEITKEEWEALPGLDENYICLSDLDYYDKEGMENILLAHEEGK